MAKPYLPPQHTQSLVQGGLTEAQASIYETLVQQGPLNARRVGFMAGLSRTLGYKILGELEALGLVIKKDEPGSVAVFTAVHPLKLKELAEKRLESAKDAKIALDGALSKLVSDFNRVSGQPGVRILEGPAGIAELLEDELNQQQPIYIIRSPKYVDFPELSVLFNRHLTERTKLKIPVKSIESFSKATADRRMIDLEHGIQRRFISPEFLSTPGDVVIYGDKVAINAYERPLMTTIIENKAITLTFSMIFNYLWTLTEADSTRLIENAGI